jgi:hypothetical protein
MAKKSLHSHYFADDKDIYDLLSAARLKLTPQKLIELARKRGIILSQDDDRGQLVEQISRLPFGWMDLNALMDATDTAERVEKTTSRSLSGAFELSDVREAVALVRETRGEVRGEVFKVEVLSNSVRVTVSYSELDPSKTRLVQRTQREFSLEFESRDGGVFVRHQDQPRAHEVLSELVDILKSAPEQSLDETRIELGGIRVASIRTQFFLQLIRGLKGFKFDDVKGVKASRFSKTPSDSLVPVDDDEASSEELDPLSEAGANLGITPDEADFVAHVKEMALKGEGLLNTAQYEHLTKHDFFVRAMVWTADEEAPSGARVEFESAFDQPEAGTGFTYAVRGLYARKADGEFRKGRASPTAVERTRLVRLLEDAAREAVTSVTKIAMNSSDPSAATDSEA